MEKIGIDLLSDPSQSLRNRDVLEDMLIADFSLMVGTSQKIMLKSRE